MKKITVDDLSTNHKVDVFIQDYSKKTPIEGVKIVEIKKFVGEDGTFEELARIDDNGELELFPGFKLKQINRSKILPKAIKAWHLHLDQEDIWYVRPEDHLLLGLWDLRKDSKTRDIKMRIVMGAGSAKLVYVPRGVAHGVANFSGKKADIIYFVNNLFNFSKPDEYRLPWDKAGADFWQMQKG